MGIPILVTTSLYWDGAQVSTVADDDLAPFVAKSSVAMVMTLNDKQALIFYEEGFPQVSSYCGKDNDYTIMHGEYHLQR